MSNIFLKSIQSIECTVHVPLRRQELPTGWYMSAIISFFGSFVIFSSIAVHVDVIIYHYLDYLLTSDAFNELLELMGRKCLPARAALQPHFIWTLGPDKKTAGGLHTPAEFVVFRPIKAPREVSFPITARDWLSSNDSCGYA